MYFEVAYFEIVQVFSGGRIRLPIFSLELIEGHACTLDVDDKVRCGKHFLSDPNPPPPRMGAKPFDALSNLCEPWSALLAMPDLLRTVLYPRYRLIIKACGRAEPDYDSFGFKVDRKHALDLLSFLAQVALVDADSVNPEEAMPIWMPKMA